MKQTGAKLNELATRSAELIDDPDEMFHQLMKLNSNIVLPPKLVSTLSPELVANLAAQYPQALPQKTQQSNKTKDK
jgi:hypothetical protein